MSDDSNTYPFPQLDVSRERVGWLTTAVAERQTRIRTALDAATDETATDACDTLRLALEEASQALGPGLWLLRQVDTDLDNHAHHLVFE